MRARVRVPEELRNLAESVSLSSAGASTTTAGTLASQAWLRACGVTPPLHDRWRTELVLDAVAGRAAVDPDNMDGTRFRIEIDRDEWGFAFAHGGRVSWVRVTNVAFVHGVDEHGLLARTPPLKHLAQLVRSLEREHDIKFHRSSAHIVTTLTKLEPIARSWLATL